MDRRTFLKMTALSTLASQTTGLASITDPAFGAALTDETEEQYWENIRAQFPITKELYYMNNGTMGPSPRTVTERVTKRIEYVDRTGEYNGNFDNVRKAVARVVGSTAEEIAFTHNVSEAISIVASGVKLKAGDEVILTDQEHAGNAIPWLARAKRDGIKVKFVTLAPDDATILERINSLITPNTRGIAVPHVTCTTGHVLPIKEIVNLAKPRGIWVMADGAHPPGMMQVNVKDLGVDAYASCGHKWLCGPKGVGFLSITPEFMEKVDPVWTGAEADNKWDYDGTLNFLTTASRYDFASQNFALFDGLQGAIEWMEEIGFEKIERRLQHLTGLLRVGLEPYVGSDLYFLTPKTSITGLTTIKLTKQNYQTFWGEILGRHKIRTRVVPESKLDANRFSVHIYTSVADVNHFLTSFEDVIKNPKKP